MGCGQGLNGTSTDGEGIMLFSGDGEPESSQCLISYSVVETVHAAIYMFIAVSLHVTHFGCERSLKSCTPSLIEIWKSQLDH